MATLSNIGISINPGRQTSGALFQRLNPVQTVLTVSAPVEDVDGENRNVTATSSIIFGMVTLMAGLLTLFGLA